MSDWNTPRPTTKPLADVRDVVELFYSRGSFLPGEVVEEADALAALASLESQNQALQEALREVGLAAHVNHPLLPGEITVGMFDTCPHLPCVKARNALSPHPGD